MDGQRLLTAGGRVRGEIAIRLRNLSVRLIPKSTQTTRRTRPQAALPYHHQRRVRPVRRVYLEFLPPPWYLPLAPYLAKDLAMKFEGAP